MNTEFYPSLHTQNPLKFSFLIQRFHGPAGWQLTQLHYYRVISGHLIPSETYLIAFRPGFKNNCK